MVKRITEQEIEKLYQEYQTPPHVIGHCRAVTEVALKIASELNQHGYHLDLALIRGAGLAHDVARVCDAHWDVGADALEHLGYVDEANIVRAHMFYQFHSVEKLDELDLVCLGDRLVKEDHYVGVDERFAYIMDKAPHNQEIQSKLLAKREDMRCLLKEIEAIIGKKIDQLFEESKESSVTGENTK